MVLVSAVWVVALGNLFRAALSLGLVFLGVAGLFLLLEAEFLAFVQILIYVGAILTLVVFAIMLTVPPPAGAATGSANPAGGGTSRPRVPAAAVSLGLFVVLASSTWPLRWPSSADSQPVPLAALGQQLVTTLVLPFEVVSLVFVAALVGAIALASGERLKPPPPA
jgi:NADH:ubiquinone oxidoreductase subunit 6 (subunit J)